jgi:hypothetical protein
VPLQIGELGIKDFLLTEFILDPNDKEEEEGKGGKTMNSYKEQENTQERTPRTCEIEENECMDV